MADPEPFGQSQRHSGYDPEQGFLERFREWNDLFPWLRLGRTLRAAASPLLVGFTLLTYLVWWLVYSNWLAPAETVTRRVIRELRIPLPGSLSISLEVPGLALPNSTLTTLVAVIWSTVCCVPCILVLTRQGALLTAGRDLAGFYATLHRSIRIAPKSWLVVLVPGVSVCCFAGFVFAAGWIAEFFVTWGWLHVPLALAIAVMAIPCGILGFGAFFAVPVGWSSMANEREADVLDSLSRGYEYLYRRPMSVLGYLVISSFLLAIVHWLAHGISVVAIHVSTMVLATAGASGTATQAAELLGYCPFVLQMTMFWVLVGGVYLLLRNDAGSQEIEDLWQGEPRHRPPLPRLDPQGRNDDE